MKSRCINKNSASYSNYGARGITVCDRWKKFHFFNEDMGDCPDGMSIDRIDNNKGYFKENCRWATTKQQQRNRSDNVILTIDNESKTVADWAEDKRCKVDVKTIYTRLTKYKMNHKDSVFSSNRFNFIGCKLSSERFKLPCVYMYLNGRKITPKDARINSLLSKRALSEKTGIDRKFINKVEDLNLWPTDVSILKKYTEPLGLQFAP
jgi:hypothetical protein